MATTTPRATASGSMSPDREDHFGESSWFASLRHVPYFARLLGIVSLLLVVGLIMVLSSSSIDSYTETSNFFTKFIRQGTSAVIGFPLMLAISRIRPRFWHSWATVVYVLALGAQLLVFTPLGYGVNGNRNWISLGGFNLQPAEALKFAMILWMAKVLAEKGDRIRSLGSVFWPLIPGVTLALAFVIVGKDLGTALMMVLIVLGVLFFSRVPLRFLVLALAAAAAAVSVFVLTSSNRMTRISSWANFGTCNDYQGTCWQTTHGTWALAAGGLTGVGLGNSKAKWSWLPEAENDFIFAVIGEELGFVGAMLVIVLFVLLMLILIRIIVKTEDPFSKLVVAGILSWMIPQALVNIAVVLGLLPVLGVPLPFISYGGSALMMSLAAMGVVLSIARHETSAPE